MYCSRDPSDTFEQTEKALRSWCGTLGMAAEQWGRLEVPDTYLRQTIDAARKELGEREKELAETAARDPRRKELERRLGNCREQIAQLADALAKGDQESAMSISGRLLAQMPGGGGGAS